MKDMKKVKHQAVQLVKDTQLEAAKSGSDTIRLWENYKDQAMMWRSLTLLQIPATVVLTIFCFVLWQTRVIVLDVPRKPLPGIYPVQDIPDTEFIDTATEYANLVATYNPTVARKQFQIARGMLREPLLSKFNDDMMVTELGAVENTARTQVFFVDPLKTVVQRDQGDIRVFLSGERWKMIAGSELPTVTSQYIITMSTIPRTSLNPYGIVISSVDFISNVKDEISKGNKVVGF